MKALLPMALGGLLLVVVGAVAEGIQKTADQYEPVLTLKGHDPTYEILGVAISPDGKRIASSTVGFWDLPGEMKLWDAVTGREILSFPPDGVVSCLAFSPDGKCLVSGGGGKQNELVKVWDAATAKVLLTLRGHKKRPYAVAFSPDSKRIVSGGGAHRGESDEGELKVWDAVTGQELLTIREGTVRCLAISPDGKRIATGGFISLWGTLNVWDAATGKKLWGMVEVKGPAGTAQQFSFTKGQGHKSSVTGVAFSPDGKRLASAGFDGTVRVWNAASGEPLLTIRSSCDQIQKVFDLDQGKLVTVPHDRCELYTLAFSPDGHWLACGGWDWSVKVLDANTGKESFTFRGHKGSIKCVAFSADSKHIVSGSDDATVKVWALGQ